MLFSFPLSILAFAQVADLEVEVRHLKRKVKGYQEEASQLSEKVRDGDRLKDY